MSCVVFTGGGTGGHIFPGIAVAEVLKKETDVSIVWIGSNNGTDQSYVCSADIPFYGIPAGKLRRYFSLENLIDVFKIIGGFFSWCLNKGHRGGQKLEKAAGDKGIFWALLLFVGILYQGRGALWAALLFAVFATYASLGIINTLAAKISNK